MGIRGVAVRALIMMVILPWEPALLTATNLSSSLSLPPWCSHSLQNSDQSVCQSHEDLSPVICLHALYQQNY